MTKLLRILGVAAAAALAATGAARAAEVALFTNTTYVDYIPGDFNAEASNLEDSLKLYHHHVRTFTGIAAGDIHSALEGQDTLLIPELEKTPLTSLFNSLSAAARAEIVDFVNGGGSLVFFLANTKSLELVNGLFGYSLATDGTTTSYPLSAGQSAGTAFQGGPPSVPSLSATNTLLFTTLPPGSRSIYFSGNGDVVSLMRQGAGYVIFLGWDWFDAPPTGTAAEGGWLDVLNAAVNQAVDPTKADVALLSDTTYVDYILGDFGSEASNIQASAIQLGHKVMPFDTITATRFSQVLTGRDALIIPEQEVASLFPALTASARDVIRGFVDGGGNLVVSTAFNGTGISLLNGLFGFGLALGSPCTAQVTPYFLNSVAAAGTVFQGGPSPLTDWSATCPFTLGSLPSGARAIYANGGDVAVASIPVGCGTVTMLAWDWFNAVPEGSRDSGWNDVLNRALSQEKRQFVANDFNGDTHGDILWRNAGSGATIIWLMEGNVRVDSGTIGAVPNPPWIVAGTGDFNRDCKADILWRNTSTGANLLWQMDGLTKEAVGGITAVPTVWQVAGMRDYNGDDAVDLLWRNLSTGANIVWFMNGFAHTAAGAGAVPPVWAVEE